MSVPTLSRRKRKVFLEDPLYATRNVRLWKRLLVQTVVTEGGVPWAVPDLGRAQRRTRTVSPGDRLGDKGTAGVPLLGSAVADSAHLDAKLTKRRRRSFRAPSEVMDLCKDAGHRITLATTTRTVQTCTADSVKRFTQATRVFDLVGRAAGMWHGSVWVLEAVVKEPSGQPCCLAGCDLCRPFGGQVPTAHLHAHGALVGVENTIPYSQFHRLESPRQFDGWFGRIDFQKSVRNPAGYLAGYMSADKSPLQAAWLRRVCPVQTRTLWPTGSLKGVSSRVKTPEASSLIIDASMLRKKIDRMKPGKASALLRQWRKRNRALGYGVVDARQHFDDDVERVIAAKFRRVTRNWDDLLLSLM